jgi:hypothetical protein
MKKNRNFKEDIIYLFNKIKNRDKFAFSKYADGEYKILINESITNCDGWKFEPQTNKKEYELLTESFKYDHKDYYVGNAVAYHYESQTRNESPEKLNRLKLDYSNNLVPFIQKNINKLSEKIIQY